MASIVEVARLAKVSVTTVSRVLGGSSHPVSEKTRARVLEAARALNYSPSALAKALVKKDTRIVGVIIGDSADPYFAAIIRGIEDVARKNGYLVIVCNSDRIPEVELQYLRTLNDYRVDAVIFAGGGLLDRTYLAEVERILASLRERGAVCLSLSKHMFASLPVLVDNRQVVKDAVDYLIDLGHERIAYISGPEGVTTSELRLDGYKWALESHGLPVDSRLIVGGDFTYAAGLAAAGVIHRLRPKPTAVMAANDIMAIGCMTALKEMGYRIPRDISVMGVDDIPAAEFVEPSLSTVAIPMYELGAVSMESFLKFRRGELTLDDAVILPHRLVARKSTVPPGRSRLRAGRRRAGTPA